MTKDPTSELAPEAARPAAAAAIGGGGQWFGHPRGLSTLFFTEMWERFSYYGMRALLILYMTAEVIGDNPGLGYGEARAGAVYGLYTGMVYLLALPGGWIADNLWGQRRAVFVGGCVIAAGHFSMAAPALGLPEQPFFFLGLLLIVIGTGLLKPNVSTMVGELYPEGGARRDAGFSIFYMGINVGAILGPTICSLLGESYNFHWGFSAAGFGMVAGLIQYKMGDRHLGEAGVPPRDVGSSVLSQRARNLYLSLAAVGGLIVLAVFLVTSGVLAVTLQDVATGFGHMIIVLTILFFAYLIFDWRWAAGFLALWAVAFAAFFGARGFDVAAQWASGATLAVFLVVLIGYVAARREAVSLEKRRLMVIFWLFLLAACFWSGFEQAGSSMNLFARDLTDRTVLGWEMPAGWLQNINPIFIVLLAPVFGTMWVRLAQRNANPSIPLKFALGLFGLAVGFFVLAWGSANASETDKVAMTWLIVTYFLHTCGELCLSPVGLSSMTKLAPRNRVGQMMGVWFIAAALGNLFAGLVAGQLEDLPHSVLFWNVALFVGGVGVIALLVSPFVRRLMGDVE